MWQQAFSEDRFQAWLHVGTGVGIADHRVQAVAQLRACRQDLVQPISKRGTIGGAAEVAGDQHLRPLRKTTLARAEQQVGKPVAGQHTATGGLVERRIAQQRGRDRGHAHAKRAHRRQRGAVAGMAVDQL
ncbi:hypothetical protein D3C72_1836300 [compost metagenome]